MVKEILIPASKANSWSFAVFFICVIGCGSIFSLVFGLSTLWNGFVYFLTTYWLLVGSIIGGALIHEALHAIAFIAGTNSGWTSIKFGFNLVQLAPYIHCQHAVSYDRFVFATLLPGLLLGVFPLTLSLVTGHAALFVFSSFMTAGAAGDFLTIVTLFHYKRGSRIKDHPDQMGFSIFYE